MSDRRPSIIVAMIRDSEGSIVAVVKRNDMIEMAGGVEIRYPYVVVETGDNSICVPLDRTPDMVLAILRANDIKMPD